MRFLNMIVLVCFLAHTTGMGTGMVWAQQAAEKKTLAILPLTPTGVAPTEANALTNQLQNELVQTNSFTIIERSRVDDILREQGLGQSGCITNECVAEAGKLLGAQVMVAGSVDKIGQTYNVVARLVDVETGRVSFSRNIAHRGEIDGLLDKMKELAQALAFPTPTPTPAPTPAPTTPAPPAPTPSRVTPPAPPRYQLRITAPADAIVYIDGQRAGQGTVTRVLPAGSYRVRVTRNKFLPWEQTVELTQNQNIAASLTPEVLLVVAAKKGSKKWVWGAAGGAAVVGGILAAIIIPPPPPKRRSFVSGSPPPPP